LLAGREQGVLQGQAQARWAKDVLRA
jgi:hypothetical protein